MGWNRIFLRIISHNLIRRRQRGPERIDRAGRGLPGKIDRPENLTTQAIPYNYP
jgi:hypothetical protein